MLKVLAFKFGKWLVRYSEEPLLANLLIQEFVGRSVNNTEVELLACYQTTIGQSEPGFISISDAGDIKNTILGRVNFQRKPVNVYSWESMKAEEAVRNSSGPNRIRRG